MTDFTFTPWVRDVLERQGVTTADLVKAAGLNRDHMPTSSTNAARLVAEVCSADPTEVEHLQRHILAHMPLDAGSTT